jgi:hypothetical protein
MVDHDLGLLNITQTVSFLGRAILRLTYALLFNRLDFTGGPVIYFARVLPRK